MNSVVKGLGIAAVVASVVTMAACQRKHEAVKVAPVAHTQAVAPSVSPSLASLDARVTVIEHRLDAAKAARVKKSSIKLYTPDFIAK